MGWVEEECGLYRDLPEGLCGCLSCHAGDGTQASDLLGSVSPLSCIPPRSMLFVLSPESLYVALAVLELNL